MRRFVQVEAGVPVLLSESEALLHSLTHISLTFSAEQRPRSGCLFVTTSRFVWLAEEKKDDEDEEEGSSECVSECVSERVSDAYDFDVKFIALHAVSRDPASYERPCLYCQVLRHSLTHSLSQTHTLPLTHSLTSTHPLTATHSPTHSPTHCHPLTTTHSLPLTHSLTHYHPLTATA
jgi:hypothetical protein